MKSICAWLFLIMYNLAAGVRGSDKAVEIALWAAACKRNCRVLEPFVDYAQVYDVSDKSIEQLHDILRGGSNERLTRVLARQAFARMSKMVNHAISSDTCYEQRFDQILHDIYELAALEEDKLVLRVVHTLLLEVPILSLTRAPRPHLVIFDSIGRDNGKVVGPDNHVYDKSLVRFNGTTGKLLQGSLVLVDDTGLVRAPGGIVAGYASAFTDDDLRIKKRNLRPPFVVSGNTGDTIIAGTLSVAGNSTLDGPVGIGGDPDNSKGVKITGTAQITGATTLDSTLGVTGTLDVASVATLRNGITVNAGGATIKGATYITGATTVLGPLVATGNAVLDGTVSVKGVASPTKFVVQDDGAPVANVLVVDTIAGGVGVKGLPTNGVALFVDGVLKATGDIDANVVGPSDERIKDNIKPLSFTKNMEQLRQVEPVSFNFKPQWIEKGSGQPGTCYGFVAQDLAKVYPHVVSTLYSNHAAVGHDILSVNQTALMPHVISALKGCMENLDNIHARLAAMEQFLGVRSKPLITKSGSAHKNESCIDTDVRETNVQQ